MAKRNSIPGNGDRVKVQTERVEEVDDLIDTLRQAIEEEPNQLEYIDFDLPEPTVQQLVLLKDLTLKVKGPVTDTEYVFNGAGSVVDVDVRDVPAMLDKISSHGCCGSHGASAYFTLLGG
jgi:hypothetical protein